MASAPVNEDFIPTSEIVQEENSDSLLLHLPGFKKEELRVQLTKGGIMRISGSRPVGDNKFSRFQKEFPISANTDSAKITAKFEGGILYVKQPKLITQAEKQDQTSQPPKAPSPQKPPVEPKARAGAPEPTDQKPDNDQGRTEEKAANGGNSGSKDADGDEEREKKGTDKPKTDSIDAAEGKGKGIAAVAKTGLANYKDISGAMASRLKMPRRVMNAVLVALVALLLAHYASNLIKKFTKAEN